MSKLFIKTISLIILLLLVNGCAITSKNHDTQFENIAQQVVDLRKSLDVYTSDEGVDGYYLPNLSAEFLASKHQKFNQLLLQLKSLTPTQLNSENQINLAILTAQVQNTVDEYVFNSHYMPLTSEFGFHSSLSFLAERADFSDQKGYELYLKRLAAVPKYFEQNIMWMKRGIETGLTQPKAVLQGYESSIAAFIVDDATQSLFYKPFKSKPEHIEQTVFNTLQQQAKNVISNAVIPAYQNYLTFFEQSYFPAAKSAVGISSVKNGEAFYRNRAKHYTTTDMSVEQIHQLGLQEVARIRSEMQQVIDGLGFKGSFADFVQFLRTDPQFYAETPEALIKQAAYLSKKMDAQLPKLFHTLPRTPYGVAPVPDSIAPKYTTGRYVGPSRDDQPGYYWVNTYGLDKRPLYVLEALTLHEAVPGHHLQISLNSELTNLPSYRQHAYISAFGEGWGLYAEWLGLEAGFYQDPYSNFGRLTYEMWRAARLVVDTGMHMMGWSREQAMNFMKQNSALSLHNIKTETDRYISWPGQALSYKIGELTIKRLRKQAQLALGKQFDVREFHHQVLRHGSVPLWVLEQQINLYIEKEKAAQVK